MQGKASDEDRLDRAFAALADPVRRGIIARLSRGPATVNELAEPFDITLQAVSRHIAVLEQAGLVTRTREAQRRPVHLDAAALEALTGSLWVPSPSAMNDVWIGSPSTVPRTFTSPLVPK